MTTSSTRTVSPPVLSADSIPTLARSSVNPFCGEALDIVGRDLGFVLSARVDGVPAASAVFLAWRGVSDLFGYRRPASDRLMKTSCTLSVRQRGT